MDARKRSYFTLRSAIIRAIYALREGEEMAALMMEAEEGTTSQDAYQDLSDILLCAMGDARNRLIKGERDVGTLIRWRDEEQ